MQPFTKTLNVVLLAIVLIGLLCPVAVACPTCKDGLAENDPNSKAVAAGYFYSILFMMSMPFVILGTFGSAAYFSICRAREQQSTQAEGPSTGESVNRLP